MDKYPHTYFKSTEVAEFGEKKLRTAGTLPIHGVTQQIILEAEFIGPEKSPYGEASTGFTAYAH